jgi:hypothetical protein
VAVRGNLNVVDVGRELQLKLAIDLGRVRVLLRDRQLLDKRYEVATQRSLVPTNRPNINLTSIRAALQIRGVMVDHFGKLTSLRLAA